MVTYEEVFVGCDFGLKILALPLVFGFEAIYLHQPVLQIVNMCALPDPL